MMAVHGLLHIAAITDNVMDPPLLLCKLLHLMIQDCRHTVDLIVRRHHCLGTALHNGAAKRLQIIFIFVARIDGGGFPHTTILYIIRIEMLERCTAPDMFPVTAHSLNICGCHLPGKIRILPICLLGTSPSRITFHVDRRRPQTQTSSASFLLKYSSRLGAYNLARLPDQLRIPACTHADRIRKNCRWLRFTLIKTLIMTHL